MLTLSLFVTYLQIAPSKEVLIGVSNVNPLREGMLDTFLSGVKQAEVSNYVIVALDTETASDLTARGFNAFYMPMQVGTGAGGSPLCRLFTGLVQLWFSLPWQWSYVGFLTTWRRQHIASRVKLAPHNLIGPWQHA